MTPQASLPKPKLVITGPTGWLGSAAVAWARRQGVVNLQTFGSSAQMINGLAITALPDMRLCDLSDAIVLHLAFLTKDKTAGMPDEIFRAANRGIDDHVIAAFERIPPKGVFVASSGAAAQPVEAYGQMKIEQEQRFLGWGQSAGVPTLVGRIYNVAGPYINKHNLYALSSMIVQARDTGVMKIDANRPIYRAYTHVNDLIGVMMAALRAGEGRTQPFDISGNELVEISDVAREVAQHIPARIERPAIDWANPSVYVGNPEIFRSLALKYGIVPQSFAGQVSDTVDFLSLNPATARGKK